MATAAFLDVGCMLDSEVAWNILAWMALTRAGVTSAAWTAARALSAFTAAVAAAAAPLSAAADALSAEAAALNADAATLLT